MPGKPTRDNKAIAKVAAAAFGGSWGVASYIDANDSATLDVLAAFPTPEQGLTSFCTIGLSDTPLPDRALRLPLGAELVGTSNHGEFANVLATAGFFVINDDWVAEPDNVFTDIVTEHFADATTPHLLLVPPYLWEDLPSSQAFAEKTVGFVMAVPITEAERAYWAKNGPDALGDALEKADPDIVDLWRASVV